MIYFSPSGQKQLCSHEVLGWFLSFFVLRLRGDACRRGLFGALALLLTLATTSLVVLLESTANSRVHNVVLLGLLLVISSPMLGLWLIIKVILIDASDSDATLSHVVVIAFRLGLGRFLAVRAGLKKVLGGVAIRSSTLGLFHVGQVLGLILKLGELFFFLLLLKLALLLFGSFKGLFLGAFQLRLVDVLLELFWTADHVDHVSQDIGDDQKDQ